MPIGARAAGTPSRSPTGPMPMLATGNWELKKNDRERAASAVDSRATARPGRRRGTGLVRLEVVGYAARPVGPGAGLRRHATRSIRGRRAPARHPAGPETGLG